MAKPATGRPPRLLDLQKSPTSQKAIAATNVINSPFLKLPAEIRQRIYNYALGGHILHVASRIIERHDTGPGPVVICSCPHDYSNSSNSIMRREPIGLEGLYLESSYRTFICLDSHRQCFRDPSAGGRFPVNFSLLQTCRQIYHEAVLVSFKKNIFAVTCTYPRTHRSTSLPKFMDSLVPAQLKAFTHLIVQPDSMSECSSNRLLRFQGLTALQCVLVVVPYYVSNPQAFVNQEEKVYRKAKLESLVELSQLRSVSIVLRTPSRGQPMLEGGSEPVPEPIKAWVASTERRLMGNKDSQSGQ